MSYVGLFSYYQFDNWAYQPSYVSSNTPWFFNGVRTQIFLTDKLKIEPWFVNGWQSNVVFNKAPGLGVQIPLYRPKGWFSFVSGNQYEGARHARNSRTAPHPYRRQRADQSITTSPAAALTEAAMTLTADARM